MKLICAGGSCADVHQQDKPIQTGRVIGSVAINGSVRLGAVQQMLVRVRTDVMVIPDQFTIQIGESGTT
ncbi:hypothetical protein [Spirosoma pomorum]